MPVWLQVVLGVLGLVGFSGFLGMVRFLREFGRLSRALRLQSSESLDIVLPTSERTEGGLGIRYFRSTTTVGNLKAATKLSQTIGQVSRKRPIIVSVSEELESPLSGDLVVIGLPGKNTASRIVVDHLHRQAPELGLRIEESDETGCVITVGTTTERFELQLQPGSQVPARDLALIVLWVNPMTTVKRRLILCAGFTGYGTAAAARYLVNDVIPRRYERLREVHPELPNLWSRTWPCFAMLIEMIIVNDQSVEIREKAFVPLADPGRPPFGAPSDDEESTAELITLLAAAQESETLTAEPREQRPEPTAAPR
jgi:hypothetical protein